MGDDDLQTLRDELRDYREQVRRARANEAAAVRQSAVSAKDASKARADLDLVNGELASLRYEVAKAVVSTELTQAEPNHTSADGAAGAIRSRRNGAWSRWRLDRSARAPLLALLAVTLAAVVAQFAFTPQRQEAGVVVTVAQDRIESAGGDVGLCPGPTAMNADCSSELVDLVGVTCETADAGPEDVARRNYEAARQLLAARQLYDISRPSASIPDSADSSGSGPTDSGVDIGSGDLPEVADGGAVGQLVLDQDLPSSCDE